MKTISRLLLAAAAIGGTMAATATPALAAGGKGMTWRVYDFAGQGTPQQKDAWNTLIGAVPNAVVVGCANKCDAYKGDTPNTETRRILCFVPGSSAEPSQYPPLFATTPFTNTASSNWRFYFGWSGGQIGLSEPVAGSGITSRAVGDAFCKDAARGLGDPNARMVEHHDNKVGGWSLGGTIHPRSRAIAELRGSCGCRAEDVKYWAAINDQPANVWNP